MARKRKERVGKYALSSLRTDYYKSKITKTERMKFSDDKRFKREAVLQRQQNFPFIANTSGSMTDNMIVYTVPETLAYRFAQISASIGDVSTKLLSDSKSMMQESINRLNTVRNICLQYEAPYKTISPDARNIKDELEAIFDNILEQSEEVRRLYDTTEVFRSKNENVNFTLSPKGKYKLPPVRSIYTETLKKDLNNMDIAIQAVVTSLTNSIEAQLTKALNGKNVNMFQEKIADYLTTEIKKELEVAKGKLATGSSRIKKIVEKVFNATTLKKEINKIFQEYYRDFNKIAESYKRAIDGLTSIDESRKQEMYQGIQTIAQKKTNNFTAELGKLGLLHEYAEMIALLKAKELNPDISLIDVDLNPYQKEITTDINVKLKELGILGASIKSNTNNTFDKRIKFKGKKITSPFTGAKNAEFISKMMDADAGIDKDMVEQDLLRFLTMSVATMYTIGVRMPPIVQSIVQNIRLAYIRMAYMKAILGSVVLLGLDQDETNQSIDKVLEKAQGFPVLIRLFKNTYWSSEMLAAGEKMLVDTNNVYNDETNARSMSKMFFISHAKGMESLNQLASQLAAVEDFRYRYLSSPETMQLSSPTERLIALSQQALPIMEKINTLFKGKMFEIYSSNISVHIDMDKYLQGGQ